MQLKKGEERCHFSMPIVFMNNVKIIYKPADNIKKQNAPGKLLE